MADPTTEGVMYCPIILGADKTTVSVATGHVEYYPLYFHLGMSTTLFGVHIEMPLSPLDFLQFRKVRELVDSDELRLCLTMF